MSQIIDSSELNISGEMVSPSELPKFLGGVRITPPDLTKDAEGQGFSKVDRSIWVHRNDLTWSSVEVWDGKRWTNVLGVDPLDIADKNRKLLNEEVTRFAQHIDRRGGDHRVLIDQEYCEATSETPDFLSLADVRLLPNSHYQLLLRGVNDLTTVSGIDLFRAGYEKIPFELIRGIMLDNFGRSYLTNTEVALSLSMRGSHSLIIEDEYTYKTPGLKGDSVKVGSLWIGYDEDVPGVFKKGI